MSEELLECHECSAQCEKVVYPASCLSMNCRFLYAFKEDGHTFFGCIEKVFPHVLNDKDAIADWLAGTMMRPYLSRLSAELQERFMDEYKVRLSRIYTKAPVFYPFRRIFFSALKTNLHG